MLNNYYIVEAISADNFSPIFTKNNRNGQVINLKYNNDQNESKKYTQDLSTSSTHYTKIIAAKTPKNLVKSNKILNVLEVALKPKVYILLNYRTRGHLLLKLK